MIKTIWMHDTMYIATIFNVKHTSQFDNFLDLNNLNLQDWCIEQYSLYSTIKVYTVSCKIRHVASPCKPILFLFHIHLFCSVHVSCNGIHLSVHISLELDKLLFWSVRRKLWTCLTNCNFEELIYYSYAYLAHLVSLMKSSVWIIGFYKTLTSRTVTARVLL